MILQVLPIVCVKLVDSASFDYGSGSKALWLEEIRLAVAGQIVAKTREGEAGLLAFVAFVGRCCRCWLLLRLLASVVSVGVCWICWVLLDLGGEARRHFPNQHPL